MTLRPAPDGRSARLTASPDEEAEPDAWEQALARQVRAGESAAFDALFDTLYEPLCRVADRYVRSSAVAEEIVQDAMLMLWQQRERVDPVRSLRLYLWQSVRRRALNHLRHRRVAERWHADAEVRGTGLVSPASDEMLARAELELAVAQGMAALPARCREVFTLSRVQGLSHAAIAERCGISIKTVEVQIGRALKALRARIER